VNALPHELPARMREVLDYSCECVSGIRYGMDPAEGWWLWNDAFSTL